MTARLLLSCDGRRHGQKCRAFWTSVRIGPTTPTTAWEAALAAGWGLAAGGTDRCPSGQHDDDPPPT